jgi:hypothetical protein
MSRTAHSYSLADSALLATLAFAPAVNAEGVAIDDECPSSPAKVLAELPADKADACAGAADAINFFEKLGLKVSEAPSITVSAQIPAEAGPTAAGCFIEDRRRIYIVPYEKFRKLKTWFGVRIDRRMYRSLAAHEAAHALAACNFSIPRPTIQAKEYVAYVAMFATMDPALRATALKARPGTGFTGDERITPLLYMFDPMRFGAESYRHFLRPEVGPSFLRSVLEGRALLE